MRTIKFRGKSLLKGKWIYGHLLDAECGENLMIQVNASETLGVDDNTVGQFTGLYDRNGKEIYEGDIIISDEYKHTRHYVRYMESEAMFVAMIIGSPLDEYCGIRQSWIDKFSKKIIGNIHDNPELLTNK